MRIFCIFDRREDSPGVRKKFAMYVATRGHLNDDDDDDDDEDGDDDG